MLTKKFKELTLPRLGFGLMRLPLREDKSIDEEQFRDMVDLAMRNGVNYFDTAYPYHGGLSETLAGRALARYPRESYFLASKYPGHQYAETYDPAAVFEDQLKKCGVEYFDFYLLHNVCESSMPVYMDPKWGILDYFKEQKRLGRIRHLGFSSHAKAENLETFLDYSGDAMEFCQIQLNYLDWTLQDAEKKVAILESRGIPVWVMEPVHGGKLAQLASEEEARLKAFRPEESIAAWAFRFLQDLPQVLLTLSGMSDLEQMKDNIRTFREEKPLSAEERTLLLEIAERMKESVPCTACRYCCDSCPQGLDIPELIHAYNDYRVGGGFTVPMQMDLLPKEKWPNACLHCGQCAAICPQKIDVPDVLEKFAELMETAPNWEKICRERAAAAAAMKKQTE